MSAYLYDYKDEWFEPTIHTGSPWSTRTQHGGPVNAVLMREAERFADAQKKQIAKLSVDILRPVPRQAMRATTTVVRSGRRLSIADITLHGTDEKAYATCRVIALQARSEPTSLFPAESLNIPGPEDLPDVEMISEDRRREGPPGFHLSLQLRHVDTADNGICWFTWPLDVIRGEPTTPWQRCAAICDVATIVSGRLRLSEPGAWDNTIRFDMLNTDTTMQFIRPPQGDWFAFTETKIIASTGIGMTQASLFDRSGLLGRVAQTVASNAE